MRVLSVFGTRPEAIKMCPLVLELGRSKQIVSRVCVTGQHRELLRQVTDVFGIKPAWDLDIMREDQTLSDITSKVLREMEPVLQRENPDLVLVQGDTTTAFAAALAAFYRKIPVGHVEAGLRTGNRYSPYPEEINRVLISRLAELHFAPTALNASNLAAEKITKGVSITGNTVIDAFKTTVRRDYIFQNPELRSLDFKNKRIVTLTAHRRENWGEPLCAIFQAVKRLAQSFEDLEVVYPVHPNPIVRQPAEENLSHCERIHLYHPLCVTDMHNLLSRSVLVMTDSGGLQEEAPAFGVPVLVLRTETERPEAVEAGTARLAGIKEEEIVSSASLLLTNPDEYRKMARAINPYGDGHASERIVADILIWHGKKEITHG